MNVYQIDFNICGGAEVEYHDLLVSIEVKLLHFLKKSFNGSLVLTGGWGIFQVLDSLWTNRVAVVNNEKIST